VSGKDKPRVASLVWDPSSQLHLLQGEAVEQLGYPHRFFNFDEPIPENTRIVMLTGPYGTLSPLVDQLMEYPPERRPVLVYWFEESLEMRYQGGVRRWLERACSELHRNHQDGRGNRLHRVVPRSISSKGNRLGFLGDILWLHQNGLLDVLALCSSVYSEHLAQLGIDSIVVPRGYHPSYGSQLGLKRNISVVWLGKPRTRRRKRVIYWMREEMDKRGQVMRIYDGKENDFIFDDERTEMLSRTWFVLNTFFSGPTDELSLRYYLAAASGAIILTEPGSNRYPFVPGKHLVERSIEHMPDTVMWYLEHPDMWRSISDNVISLMKNHLTLEQSFSTILAQAERILIQRFGLARVGSYAVQSQVSIRSFQK